MHSDRYGTGYISVTEFIKKFEPEFPSELIAEKIAKRDGVTAESVLAEWKLNSEISCDYGNSIHKGIEFWVDFCEFSKIEHVKLATQKFTEKYDRAKLKSEQQIKSDELKLAGTIDLLEKLGNKQVNLIDLKTNYDIHDTEGKKKGYFLAPLTDLKYTTLNKYRLQLSLYKHLLSLKGIKVKEMCIEWWNGQDFETIKVEPINQNQLNKCLTYL